MNNTVKRYTNEELTDASSDQDFMREYNACVQNACGESVGSTDQTPAEAVASEGWEIIRTIHAGTNQPGTPVLAKDLRGRVWLVNDDNGPWGVLLSDSEYMEGRD